MWLWAGRPPRPDGPGTGCAFCARCAKRTRAPRRAPDATAVERATVPEGHLHISREAHVVVDHIGLGPEVDVRASGRRAHSDSLRMRKRSTGRTQVLSWSCTEHCTGNVQRWHDTGTTLVL